MKLYTTLLVFFSYLFATLSHASLLNIEPTSLDAQAWIVMDPQSGQTIAEYNSDVQRAPASLTKMMVAYIALKEIKAGRLDRNEIITATPIVNVVQWDESQMYLKPTEQISVDQLLAGLVVMSANDAAVTLAERISGTLANFIQRMNQEAQALGMKNSHFANPAGITMDDHYSTAHDLAILGRALTTETPEYLYYSKQQSFTYNQRYHRATNMLLKQDPTVDGLKTGFTRQAGYNLALTAIRPTNTPDLAQRRMIVVVLGAKSGIQRAEIAHKLMNVSYAYTRNEIALKNHQLIAELPVVKSTLKMFKVQTKQPSIITTSLYDPQLSIDMNNFDDQTQRLVQQDATGMLQTIEPLQQTKTHMNVELLTNSLTAPLAQLTQLARVKIYQNNQLIHTVMIEDEIKLEQASFLEKLMNWFKNLFSFGTDSNAQAKVYPLG